MCGLSFWKEKGEEDLVETEGFVVVGEDG